MSQADPPITGNSADQATTPAAPRPLPKGEPLVDLHSGKGFRIAESDEICKAYFTTVILFAGTAKCGKTTLLSSLELLFQNGPFAGYLFGGSRTLVGFEERSYYAEVISGLPKPTMERTKFTELLHLRIRDEGLVKPSCHILLCDLWGEDFRDAKDSLDACKKLDIIRRADCFVLLVDGEKLADFASRHAAKNDAITLLRSCLDAEMLGPHSAIDVLFTKWDFVQSQKAKAEAEAFTDHVEESILRQFKSRVKRIRTYRVAAHPHDPDVPLGSGLEMVFKSWLDNSRVGMERENRAMPAQVACEYDRFLWRMPTAIASGGK